MAEAAWHAQDPRRASGLKAWLKAAETAPSHRRGQNFLIAPEVADAIVRLVPPGDVLEIGPGVGALTLGLLEQGHRVVAIEYDRRLAALLSQWALIYAKPLTVVVGDAVSLSWRELASQEGLEVPLTIVGNLPYYISAPLLAKLWEDGVSWGRAVLMLQREVAERLVAEPGEREAGAISALVRWVGRPRWVRVVPPHAFYPQPAVHSAVVTIDRAPSPAAPWWAFRDAVRAGFQFRRKTLRQALARGGRGQIGSERAERVLRMAGIDADRRAESLTMAEWIELAQAIAAELEGGLEHRGL
ncbi:MAG: 16S rRNA (adenine(1518)-N(6)/adenine(1519)-N(6))-dimethyltransferase RsmA [Firmicutes bacterium]|nr:16S rRNA (adenine(1518)-N(6)/adenine(1519)-N(6))-dimethyltransferase RsmA [Bacillota bacterium]